jgi:hypothetical protein
MRQAMPRPRTQLDALSPGQLARRWGLSVDRVRRLIEGGKLPGSFKVPAAGRYGEAVRVPLAVVLQAEQDWAIAPVDGKQLGKPRKQHGSHPPLKHFPELRHVSPGPDAESPSGGPH